MDELELELRRTLRDPARDVAPGSDPVAAVHAGMRRRARGRTAAGVGTVVLSLSAIVAALLLSGGPVSLPDEPAITPTLAPVVSPTVVASSSISPSPVVPSGVSGDGTSGAPVVPRAAVPIPPAGVDFAAVDVAFVGDWGWALGSASCNGVPCAAMRVTNDGGATWQPGLAPPAAVIPEGTVCPERHCVNRVRFAGIRDGYAFGGSQFTSSVGLTWQLTDSPSVHALEPGNGGVIRVVTSTEGCPPSCSFVAQRSEVGSSKWTDLKNPFLSGVRARLLRQGDDVYVIADQNRAGGVDAHAQIIVSHDNGASWQRRADPCTPIEPGDKGEFDATDAAVGADGTVVLLCTRRGDSGFRQHNVRVSTDAARTFGPGRILQSGAAGHIGVASAKSIVVSAGRGSTIQLLRSTDGGRNFTTVLTRERTGPVTDRLLGFSSAGSGSWIDGDGTSIWRTTDAGKTWTERLFN